MPVATPEDMACAAMVLVGDDNWRKTGRWRDCLMAVLFGRRTRFVHLGMRCTVAWWRDQPYLIWMTEEAG